MIDASVGHAYKPLRAIIWALIGNFFYASENAIAKALTDGFHPSQILFFYGATMLAISLVTMSRSGGMAVIRTNRLRFHVFRSLTMIATFYTYILALTYLPLADVIAILFVTPFIAILLSMLFLGEKISFSKWVLLMIAFSGVLVIVQPNADMNMLGVVWALFCACLAGLDTILTRKLTTSETNLTIVFYLAASYVILTGIIVPFFWITPDLFNLLTFVGMGIAGAFAQYAITYAYRFSGPPVISPLDYSMLLWGLLFGYLIWGDLPTIYTYLGSALLLTSSLAMIYFDYTPYNREER